MWQEILTPRIKLILVQPPLALCHLQPPPLSRHIYPWFIDCDIFSLLSCSFIQFNVHTSRVGPFHLFFCDTMATTSFFFFHLHLSDSFLNRYTYRHLCIYAPRDLNIHCSELFQLVSLLFLLTSSSCIVLVSSLSYWTNLDLFFYLYICISNSASA